MSIKEFQLFKLAIYPKITYTLCLNVMMNLAKDIYRSKETDHSYRII